MLKLKLEIARNIIIDRPLPEVNQVLSKFETWPHWSPWICMDKQTQLDFFGKPGAPGSGYRWSSQWIGEGEVQLQSLTDDTLQLQLNFFTPWRSEAKASFQLKAVEDERTEVTWTLQGSLTLLLFFMKSTMEASIGRDYERGLLMLKDYLETGTVWSDTEVCGIINVPGIDYLGIRRACMIGEIGVDIKSARADLFSEFKQAGLKQIAAPFTLIHEWNQKTGRCDFTFASPITTLPANLQIAGLVQSARPSVKALKLRHSGEYRHLGNAWATGFSRIQKDKTMRLNKHQAGFEVYVSDPAETAVKDLHTEVFIPVL